MSGKITERKTLISLETYQVLNGGKARKWHLSIKKANQENFYITQNGRGYSVGRKKKLSSS